MEVRRGYRLTKLGVIPEQWEVKSLGEVAIIKDGTHQTPKYVSHGVPFFSVEHVTSGNFRDTKFISEEEHRFLTRSSRIERGDILMTRIGSIGDCKLIDWDVEASFYVSLALLKIRTGFSAAYIAHYSKSAAFIREMELHSLQSAIPKKINLGPISDVNVAMPPRDEQFAIAATLSDVDALLAGLDRLVAKKRDLKQAAMQQLLTGQTRLPGFQGEWGAKRLSELAEIRSGGTPSTSVASFWNGSIPWCTPTDITALRGRKHIGTTAKTLTTLGLRASSAEFIPPQSVVMTSRATIGACAINLAPITTNQGFKNFVPREQVDVDCLYYMLQMHTQGFVSLCGGSTFLEIGKNQLAGYEIQWPTTLEEQTAIANVFSDMDAELTALEARRDKTRALKQGMMQELLTGKTRLI